MRKLFNVFPLLWILLIEVAARAENISRCSPQDAVRLGSYNLYHEQWMEIPKYWHFRSKAVMSTLQNLSMDVDVLHLQEVSPERYQIISAALPAFTMIPSEGGLLSLIKKSRWQLLESVSLLRSQELSVQSIRLIAKNGHPSEPQIFWNLWLNPSTWNSRTLNQAIHHLLLSTQQRPDWISLSLNAPDDLRHDRRDWQFLIQRHGFVQANANNLDITTNGWWAIKWTTQDWHDAILANHSWTLSEAKLLRQKHEGSYPSTHFPLISSYCSKHQLLVEE